ncbi:MAG: DMT family transporter [Desulfonatronovibrionaceae bacterium]
MRDQQKAYLYGVLTVLIWSTVASAFKISLRYLDVVQLLFYSSLTSLFCLFILAVFFHGPRFTRLCSRGDILRSALLGLLNPFLYYLVLFKAYDLLPAQEAQPLNYTWGITITILAVPLLGQKITARRFAAIVVSYLGVVVISTHGTPWDMNFSDPWGVFLALFSTLIWALYWIANTKDKLPAILRLLLNFLAGTVYLGILLPFVSTPLIFSLKGLAGAVYVGLFEMGITFVFWLQALKYSKTTAQVSNLIYLSPFLSLVFIHYLVGEKILVSTLIGLVLILCGLILQSRAKDN